MVWQRAVVLPALALLVACSEADAASTQRAVEGAVESFFISIIQWFLVMFLIAMLVVVTWSLLIGGAAAAIVAGLRRMRSPESEPVRAGGYDPVGIGMTVFGVVLLLTSVGSVCSVTAGPTGSEVSIPVPIIALGAGLVLGAKRRARRRSSA